MKKLAVIVILLCAFQGAALPQGLSTFNGEARYEYQLSTLSRGNYSLSTSTHIPSFHIGTSGSIVAPSVFSFQLRTNISSNFANYDNPAGGFSSRQYQWNFYDLNANMLSMLPLMASFHLNDGITEFRVNASPLSQSGLSIRRQNQTFKVQTNNIPSIPSTMVFFDRAEQWALDGTPGQAQLSRTYGFNMQSGSKGGSLNLSGSTSEVEQESSGPAVRYDAISFRGSRVLAVDELLDMGVTYNKFQENIDLGGSVNYSNAGEKSVHTYSALSGHANSGSSYHSNLVNFSQSVHYIQNENFRYVGSVGGFSGEDVFVYGNGPEHTRNNGGSVSASVSHSRSLGTLSFSNGLSAGADIQKYNQVRAVYSTGLLNSLQTSLFGYGVNLSHDISFAATRDIYNMNTVTNNATLNINGMLLDRFTTQLTSNYRSSIYTGETHGYGNTRDVFLQWSLMGNFMEQIPFSLGANGSVNWLLAGYTGRLYSWNLLFQSQRFFVANMGLNYRFGRTFEPMYGRASISHHLETHYQWRALNLSLQWNNYQLDQNQSQYWFIVSRPF